MIAAQKLHFQLLDQKFHLARLQEIQNMSKPAAAQPLLVDFLQPRLERYPEDKNKLGSLSNLTSR
jgi:hypothetical protein